MVRVRPTVSARTYRRTLNLWPPLVGAGIRIVELSDDFLHVKVRLRLGFHNKNALGTHFGGSLFAMADPFPLLLLVRHLGEHHVVWDKRSEIEFVSPGRGDVFVQYTLTPELIEEFRSRAADGSKVLHWFDAEVTAENGDTVARIRKQLYVRRKRDARVPHARTS